MKTRKKYLILSIILCVFASAFFLLSACDASSAWHSDKSIVDNSNQTVKGDADSVTVDVTDFGADPTGAKDSVLAIQAAIECAKSYAGKGRHVIIDFPKGRYDIYPDKAVERKLFISNTTGASLFNRDKKIGILLDGVEDVTIDGNGSLFMFHGKMTTFACIDCKNVTFKNFEVDFQTPTVIDITVERLVGSNSAIVKIPDCYNYSVSANRVKFYSDNSPYTGEPYWSMKSGREDYTQRYDKNTELVYRGDINKSGVFSRVSKIRDLGEHRIQITYFNRSGEVIPNMCFQMRPTVRDHAGAFLWKSKDVRLENLDIRFLHGFGVVGQGSEDITFDDVDFQTDEDRGTSTSGYADFIQMSGCKGKIDIGNCTFSNPHDDPINIHGTYLQVVGICKNKVTVRYKHSETAGFPSFNKGDKIEFVDNSTLTSVADSQRTVIAVDGPDGTGGKMGKGSVGLRTIVLTLDAAPPSGVVANNKFYVENVSCSPDVHIHDNIFKRVPTRGVLATTRGEIVIENNVFDGMGMAGIYISDDASDWYESGRVENVTIKKNVFLRSQAQAILIEPTNRKVFRSAPVHFNVAIEDNTFFTGDKYVLEAKSVKGLRFANNKIYMDGDVGLDDYMGGNFDPIDALSEIAHATDGSYANFYRLRGCTDVVIEDNVYQGGINAVVEYSDMFDSDITVVNDKVTMIEVASENLPEYFIMMIVSYVLLGVIIIVFIPLLIILRGRRRLRKNIKKKAR